MSLMPWDMDEYSRDELVQAARDLKAVRDGVSTVITTVTKEKIADALGSIAEMLQVSVPSPIGLKLYFHALKDMPAYKFEAACMSLIRTHKWPRLPLPADFIEAAQDERKDVDLFLAKLSVAENRIAAAIRFNGGK